MSNKFTYMPPTTFRFSVLLLNDLSGDKQKALDYLFSKDESVRVNDRKFKETGFKSVSGLEVSLETEPAQVGGINDVVYQLPKKVKYSNLVLNRGIAVQDSFLTKWFWLQQQQDGQVIKKDLLVSLLSPQNVPMIIWLVLGAYPISWKSTNLDATENQILYEEIQLAYNSFEIIKQ